ncbi:hypothetical protein [Streptomyces sp. NPDC048266]|uniref:hypothetical protein n=1 Tax=Streptomyces sp. NPDC048266 TaxID=3155787 RepID=UPI00340DE5F8
MTRADGTVVTEPAKQTKATVPARRSKGPAVCAICGYAIKGRVLYSWERGRGRNKPVHPRCDPKAARAPAASRFLEECLRDPAAEEAARGRSSPLAPAQVRCAVGRALHRPVR